MEIIGMQSAFVSEITESIYTFSITAKENKFRANMKILREMILTKRVDASKVSPEVMSNCLWFAVLDRDTASVDGLMLHHPNANLVRADMNMLWMAIIRGDYDIARILIEGGADVNQRIPDENGPSFLHFLATTSSNDVDSLRLAELMIQKGADVNACAQTRYTVLQTALTHEAVPFVRMLMDNGAQVDVEAIVIAAGSGKSTELLPIIVDVTDNLEATLALVFGALQSLIEMDADNLTAIEALLSLGLPVLQLDIEGWTVLRMAVHYGKIDVVKLLLNHGADVNQKSDNGNFPLFWAAANDNSSMAELLIESGSDVHERNDNGRCAIHGACESASSENIQLLLRCGANVNVVDEQDSTPFSLLDDELSEPHKLIIEHLAGLVRDEAAVNDADMEKIRECPKMLAYYEGCLEKLREK